MTATKLRILSFKQTQEGDGPYLH